MGTGPEEAGTSALAAERLFTGPGEVRAICRALDWSLTALGPVEHWPQSLKTAADLCLSLPEPASLFWGPRRTQLYNDAFLAIAAERHPVILGRAGPENWSDGWYALGPLIEGVLADGSSRSAEHLPVKLRRGEVLEERRFSLSVCAIRDEQGQPAGAFLRISETTGLEQPVAGQDTAEATWAADERARTEQALRASESRFRTLVQNVRDYAIFMIDPGGIITEWTEGAERVTGYSAPEAVGQHVSLFYPLEDVTSGEAWRELVEVTRTGRVEREAWRVRKGGERFWANEIASAVHDASGRLLGFTKISRDLSERKHMQDALRDVEQRHRLIVESARDFAIFMTDPEGHITTWNPGAEHLFGYSALEITGRSAASLLPPEAMPLAEFERELVTAAAEGRASDDGWRLRKDGTRFWASGVTASMRDAAGKLRGFVKVLRDVTEARRAEQERERVLEREQAARREAETAMRMRDEFVAVVSHELRTPLSAILLWARMLRSGTLLPHDEAQALRVIEQSAAVQRKLIDDLLDASRMLQGKVQLSVREVELAPLVEAAIEVVRPMSEAKGVRVTAELDGSAPRARVDPDRLQQVLWNLLHNALKFTPGGGHVCVRLSSLERAVRLEVKDTGRGIGAEFLPRVFERFRQADASITREHGGLGLGLSIAHQLVELHGGTIRAASAGEGHGAAFTVELPLAGVGARPGSEAPSSLGGETKPPPFLPAPLLSGVRVLIVEDEAHTRTVLQWLLEQCEAEVTATGSAEESLAALADGACFDVLVSDVGLPGHDGYTLLRQVREHLSGSRLPALALTAHARDEDRSRAQEAGFEAYLSKPVEPRVLIEAIAGLARR